MAGSPPAGGIESTENSRVTSARWWSPTSFFQLSLNLVSSSGSWGRRGAEEEDGGWETVILDRSRNPQPAAIRSPINSTQPSKGPSDSTAPTSSFHVSPSPLSTAGDTYCLGRMEGNKDEALRCLSIAQKHRNAGNYGSAQKFIQKSLALFATPEAEKLAGIIESEASASTSTSNSRSTEEATKASGTERHPSSGGAHHRHPNGNTSGSGPAEGSSSGSEKKREYTPDQLAVVKRVRACKVTEYYEILALKTDCEEAEVKKAYRKVRAFVF